MDDMRLPLLAWLIFLGAALLEVGGDAVVRKGLRESGWPFVLAGCLMLAGYGLLVNMVKWDFSKLLGVYVAVFALVSVLFARIVIRESVPTATWLGLILIIAGAAVIQFGAPDSGAGAGPGQTMQPTGRGMAAYKSSTPQELPPRNLH